MSNIPGALQSSGSTRRRSKRLSNCGGDVDMPDTQDYSGTRSALGDISSAHNSHRSLYSGQGESKFRKTDLDKNGICTRARARQQPPTSIPEVAIKFEPGTNTAVSVKPSISPKTFMDDASDAESSPGSTMSSGMKTEELSRPEAPPARPAPVMWKGQVGQAYQYADEIYQNLLINETKFRPRLDYMETVQTDITHTMRSILVDWLVEVGEEYKLSPQTLWLTISYIDSSLSLIVVNRNKLQLLGITCMLIAAKYEEIYPPTIDDFVYISDSTYTKQQVLNMESLLLTSLNFRLSAATPWEFARRFCGAANLCERTTMLSHFITEMFVLEPGYLKHQPSIVAASSVCLALLTTNQTPWTEELALASGYTADRLVDCVRELHTVYLKAMKEPQTLKAVREKYKESKRCCVASIPQKEVLFINGIRLQPNSTS